MNRAALVMAFVAAFVAAGGTLVLALPARSEASTYGKRIAGTMLISGGLILAMFAWGLTRVAG